MSTEIKEKPPHAQLFEMLFGAWTAKILAEVVRLNVPDALEHGPMTADELVQRAGIRANPQALHRALRACAALGIVTEDATGRFGSTRLSYLLTRNAPATLKRMVEYSGGVLWKIWSGLADGLATGAPQSRAQLGMEFFDYLSAHPKSLEEFGAVVEAHSATANRGVLERYDFAGIRKLVDVGAGFGHLVTQGIVLTGGGSQLPGLRQFAERVLARPARIASLQPVAGLPPDWCAPAFSTAVGLIQIVFDPGAGIRKEPRSSASCEPSYLERVGQWLRRGS